VACVVACPVTERGHPLVGEVVTSLDESSSADAAELVASLIAQMPVEATGVLMEKLPPVAELDYSGHPIQLCVSSSEIGVRLLSVEKEPFTVDWIERSVKPGDVFYDIGANVGAYSLIAAKAIVGARIFAFEPWPASFHDLSGNVLLNDAERIVALPLALWSRTCLLSLRSSVAVAGAARHEISERVAEEAGTVTVLGVCLDDLVERWGFPAPTHAKIDTDGSELEALRGGERTLLRPEWQTILVELDRHETRRNRDVRKLLAAAGFDDGYEHERLPSLHFPQPKGGPDVYWTFRRRPTRTA